MQVNDNYRLANELIRRIVAPSNQTEVDKTTQSFNPDRTHPIYTLNLSGPTLGDTHKILDKLYHSKRVLNSLRPSNSRIGSVNDFQADINELARLIIYDMNIDPDKVKKPLVLDKALTMLLNYSGLSELEFYYLYLYVHQYKYPWEGWSRLAGDYYGLAMNEPELAERILEEVFKVQQRSLATSASFNQWTNAFKRTLGDEWLFERFLKQVNGPEATGKANHPNVPYYYRKFSPSMPKYSQRNITINDFPGPGLIVYGLRSPLFPKDYLKKRFFDFSYAEGISGQVDANYRDFIVQGERHLNKTIFAFFRGGYLIYNPEIMKIMGKPCGLLVFNDHFPSKHINTSYLVHSSIVEKFLRNPFYTTGRNHILYPNLFEHREELKKKYIKLVSIAATSGFCEEVPGCDFTKTDVSTRRRLHKEIKDASLYGFAQLDLLREAYRLYNLGYSYNRQRDDFYLDEFVMLKELLRINRYESQKIHEVTPELPITFPFTFFDHTIDNDMIRNTGFVGANMVVYKNNPKGDCMLFPDTIADIEPDDIDNLSIGKIRDLIGGEEEYSKWADFREACEYYPANPLIVDSIYKNIGSNVIATSSA